MIRVKCIDWRQNTSVNLFTSTLSYYSNTIRQTDIERYLRDYVGIECIDWCWILGSPDYSNVEIQDDEAALLFKLKFGV